jgi:hypothetical protein
MEPGHPHWNSREKAICCYICAGSIHQPALCDERSSMIRQPSPVFSWLGRRQRHLAFDTSIWQLEMTARLERPRCSTRATLYDTDRRTSGGSVFSTRKQNWSEQVMATKILKDSHSNFCDEVRQYTPFVFERINSCRRAVTNRWYCTATEEHASVQSAHLTTKLLTNQASTPRSGVLQTWWSSSLADGPFLFCFL